MTTADGKTFSFMIDEWRTTRRGPRICFVTDRYPPDFGGVARSAERVVSHLGGAGYDMHVLVRSIIPPSGPILPREKYPPYVIHVPSDPLRLQASVNFFHERIRFDLFHGFSLPSAYACIAAAARYSLPLIANISDFNRPSYESRSSQVVLMHASWIVSSTAASLSCAHRVVDVAPKSSVICSSVEPLQLTHWSLETSDRGTVGTVGTLGVEKQVPLLTQAYTQLDIRLRRHLMLVGDCDPLSTDYQDNRTRMKWLLKSLHVENETIWPGHVPRSEVMTYLQRMHVFVMAPEHPGISNSLLEAAAAGVPIVATAIEGIRDFFSHGINCLLVPPRDATALSRAIETIMRDDRLARHLGTGARRLTETTPPAAERSEYCKLYAHLLDNRLLEPY